MARLDINEKMLPVTFQIFSKSLEDKGNDFDDGIPEDLQIFIS